MSTQGALGGRVLQEQEGRRGPPREAEQSGSGEDWKKDGQPGLRRSRLPWVMLEYQEGPGAAPPRLAGGGPW